MTEAEKDEESFLRIRGKTVDDWNRARWELTKQETCWGACKASQEQGWV